MVMTSEAHDMSHSVFGHTISYFQRASGSLAKARAAEAIFNSNSLHISSNPKARQAILDALK